MDSNNTFSIPMAIVIAGVIIAGAIFYTNQGGGIIAKGNQQGEVKKESATNLDNFRPVSEDDHIRGNPDAPITIVEFSDFECPFCARYHPTLDRLVEENDDVKWVYRHFPLTSIHSEAQSAAVASECVAKLGTDDDFWSFSSALFEKQRQLGDELYKELASEIGIDEDSFDSCMSSEEMVAEVNADLDEAVISGGTGTPFSVIITSSGEHFSFSGALQYEQVLALIDQARD